MSTFRQDGLVAELGAVSNEVNAVGDAGFQARYHAIYTKVTGQWFPVVTGPIYQHELETLAQDIADQTGRPNCLDQDDAAGAAQGDEQVAQGDLAANLAAGANDLQSSAGQLYNAAGNAVGGAASVSKWIVVALVALAVIVLVRK